MDQTTHLKPEPAKPVLASQLLELEERQRLRFTRGGGPERLTTACVEIDDLLGGGGMERGIVVGISAEGGEGRLISLNLLASVLLSHLRPATDPSPKPASKIIATIIDTTGSFPLSLLAKLLRSRIVAAHGTPLPQRGGKSRPNPAEASVDADVQRCLEMVGISRVFDFEGLWEVLGEVGRGMTDPEERDDLASKKGKATLESRVVESPEKELEIPNSDEDDDDSSLDSPLQRETRVPDLVHVPSEDEGVEILIVDNLANVINELFTRKEKSHAHNLISLLSLTLTNLTQSTNILAVLHNTTVSSKSPSSRPASNYNYYPQNQHQHQRHSDQAATQSTTLFPSNPIKPALGQIFTQFPALHLFLSSLPLRTTDAETLYGGAHPGPGEDEDVQYCTVIEVLKDETPNLGPGREDRWLGYREGRWCAVEQTGGGGSEGEGQVGDHVRFQRTKLELEPFSGAAGARVRRRGLGAGTTTTTTTDGEEHEHEHEDGNEDAIDTGGRGVSNVAKIWGFGGRRV